MTVLQKAEMEGLYCQFQSAQQTADNRNKVETKVGLQVEYKDEKNNTTKPKSKAQTNKDKKKEDIDYKKDTETRPTYSFAAMITMAIRSSPTGKLILREIYEYISKNFPFYKMTVKGWQNSVRHNLSMHKCFQKIPREGNREHKGNYWGINELGEDVFQDGDYKRRRKMKHHTRLSVPNGMYGAIEDPDVSYPRYPQRVQHNLGVSYTNGVFASANHQHLDSYSQCHQVAPIPTYNHLSPYTSQSPFTSHAILPLSPSSGNMPSQIAPSPSTNSFAMHPCMNQAQQQGQTLDMQYPHSNIYCYPYPI